MGGSSSKGTFTAASTGDAVAAAFPGAARGKTVLVTGANVGLGLETARVLAAHGASVIVASRSASNGDAAVASIRASVPGADVSSVVLDLGDAGAVRRAAAEVAARGRGLHVLINNAGVMACPLGYTKDGWETQFGTNHMVRGRRGRGAGIRIPAEFGGCKTPDQCRSH
jgi:retinol dehydrogenase 12